MPDGRSFCFLHAADLHLDAPVRGLGSEAPEVASLLRDASLGALDAIVELAIDRRCAFVVLAGDLYDGPERGLRAQLRLREALARLSDAGVASFVVHGNHDPVEVGWSAIASWPQRCHVFGTGEPDVVPVVVGGDVVATVQGVSYAKRATTENLALRLRRPVGPGSDPSGATAPFHVGVLHCNVAGSPGSHENYSPCSLAELRSTHLDYLALGHVHQRCVLSEGSGPGDPWVVYPGNTQAHSFRTSDEGAKGAYVVRVEDGRVAALEFEPCDQVRFARLEVQLGETSTLAELAELLLARAEQVARGADGRAILLRAELVGETPLCTDLARPQVLDDLLAHVRDESRALVPMRFWDRIVDSTRGPAAEPVAQGRADFAGELTGVARALLADAPAASAFVERAAAGLPRALAARLAGAMADHQQRVDLLERGARRALDELAGTQR